MQALLLEYCSIFSDQFERSPLTVGTFIVYNQFMLTRPSSVVTSHKLETSAAATGIPLVITLTLMPVLAYAYLVVMFPIAVTQSIEINSFT